MSTPRFILASSSPRRAELLRAAGFEFEVVTGTVDESLRAAESPEDYVRRIADAKAAAVAKRRRDLPVIAADTIVVVDETVLGKPKDDQDARRMLRLLSGRTHEVLTGVTLSNGRTQTAIDVTTVEFSPISDSEIDWYVASGEPADKAGAYAIQGLASRFIRAIEGSYSNVVGLPVDVVYLMLSSLSEP
jgi:septum formation protein